MPEGSKSKEPGSTIKVVIVGALIAAGLLCFSALPNFIHGRSNPKNTCINNLRRIERAKQQWTLENRKNNSDVPTVADLKPYFDRVGLDLPQCPSGGTYTLGPLSNRPTCSIPDHVLP